MDAIESARGPEPSVPPEVAMVLEQLRSLMGDWTVDDPDAGLAFQYRSGSIDLHTLAELRDGQERLAYLVETFGSADHPVAPD